MIQKIRELMAVREGIVALNKDIGENKKIVSDLKAELEALNKQLDDIKTSQKEFLKNFEENLEFIKNFREEFQKELFEFKLLKSQMQKKILDKFEEELKKDLESSKEILRKDLGGYNELRKKVDEMLLNVKSASDGVVKFVEVSKSIKKEDFELSNFARQLHFADREKLGLMRRIEQLENVIAKMRRERPRDRA